MTRLSWERLAALAVIAWVLAVSAALALRGSPASGTEARATS